MAIAAVDDDLSMLTLVEVLLSRKGFSVLKVHGPEAALQLVQRTTPDLFVVDIMMPNINGVELCKLLRQRRETAETPIIIFSSYGNNDIVRLCLESGANAFLSKSDLTRLPALVNELLSARAERRHYAQGSA